MHTLLNDPLIPKFAGLWRLGSFLAENRGSSDRALLCLERALDLLQSWLKWRDVSRRIGPAVPLDAYWDVFTLTPFAQPYIEIDES